MGLFTYFLAFAVLQYLAGFALSYPYLAAAALVIYLCRRWLPDPYLFFKHAGRVHSLKADISQNAENVTARRDLAKIWLEKRRPRRALPPLEEARRRERDSAELAFLYGKALVMAGRPEAALAPLVEAAQRNERLLYGEAYLWAGRALVALGRAAEAEDALERYVAINSSSVEGRVRLAGARRAQQDRKGAEEARRQALETFAQIPRFRRRAELGWYLRACLMRVGLA
jgi:tetratricopeptide (TPR) repeat protein